MKNKYVAAFEDAQISAQNRETPEFKAGDTLRLGIRIKEGEKTRIQIFEGLCISIRGEGVGKTIIVRKMGANNIGVERVFPLHSESLESIEVLRRGKVRRAKLFYLRELRGKAARIKELKPKKS